MSLVEDCQQSPIAENKDELVSRDGNSLIVTCDNSNGVKVNGASVTDTVGHGNGIKGEVNKSIVSHNEVNKIKCDRLLDLHGPTSNVKCSNGYKSSANSLDQSENASDASDKSSSSLKPILVNSINESSRSPVSNSPSKKVVTFGVDVEKFVDGDPILDKYNPFRNLKSNGFISDQTETEEDKLYIIKRATNGNLREIRKPNISPLVDEEDDGTISTEEVLNQSKYVKTYIKNPDKYFTLNTEEIRRLQIEDGNRNKPVPAPRKLSKSTKERLKELTTKYSPGHFYSSSKTKSVFGANQPKRHYLKGDQSKYPDLSDIKVKVGTDIESSLYNPDEVAKNVRRFDSRFKEIDFGSQDDIDEIAEKTDAELEVVIDKDTHAKVGCVANKEPEAPLDAEDEKKSLTNTVKSAEFQEYLRRKNLTLIPIDSVDKASPVAKHMPLSLVARSAEIMDNPPKDSVKRKSVFQRLLQSSIFASGRGKTIPADDPPQLYGRVGQKSTQPHRRVVLDKETSPKRTSSIPLTAGSSLKKRAHVPAEDFIDVNFGGSPLNGLPRQRASISSFERIPKSPADQIKQSSSFSRIDMTKSKLYQNRLQNGQVGELSRSSRIPQSANHQPAVNSQPFQRNRNYQSLNIHRPVREDNLYGNILVSPIRREPNHVPLDPRGRISNKSDFITPSSSNELILSGPKFTSTPTDKDPSKGGVGRKPNPQASEVNIDYHTWAQLKQMKEVADNKLLKTPHTQQENIYESTEKLINPQLRVQSGGVSQPNQLVSGQQISHPKPAFQIRRAPGIQAVPYRSQSAMGNMIGSASQPVTAQKNAVSYSREEILAKLYEYCEKSKRSSMQKLNMHMQPQQSMRQPSAKKEISPVSYVSVQNNIPQRRIPPRVPVREQSLQSINRAPSYDVVNKAVVNQKPPSNAAHINAMYSVINRGDRSSLPINQMMPPNIRRPPSHSQSLSRQQYPRPYMVQQNSQNEIIGSGSQDVNTIYRDPQLIQQQMERLRSMGMSPQLPFVRQNLDGRNTPLVLQRVPPQMNTFQPIRYSEQLQRYPSNRTRGVTYESESGSEAAGEIMHILEYQGEDDWQNEKTSGRNQQQCDTDDRRRGGGGGGSGRREDPRRHTLGADMMQYGGQGQPLRSMDLEMGTRSQKNKKGQPMRGYATMSQGPLFDDDPGIMSEVETASTGFRRGGKQRSSLPVVRTPSKTLERPLGLVFLQYRSETKRALLPNEITSIDTVRALFVRSFPRQLTMAYLEGPNVKIYIHDASKDMFYELEDVRSHLREIRDRSVLRLFESNEVAAPQALPGGAGIPQPLPQTQHWDQDQNYFSEPEFDTEYQHQHIHKNKVGGGKGPPYYVGSAQTLPRGMYSDRNKNAMDGYMSSPERGTRTGYEEPYYSQYGTRGNTATPIIDEEQCDPSMNDDQYSVYSGAKIPSRRNANQLYDPNRPEDLHRIRVEHMERQLANLTGLVQKALIHNPQIAPGNLNQNYLGANVGGSNSGTLRSDKSVSFEKSVSFSDDIQDGTPKSHTPQHPGKSMSFKITAV